MFTFLLKSPQLSILQFQDQDEPYHNVGSERNMLLRRPMIWKWWDILSVWSCFILFWSFELTSPQQLDPPFQILQFQDQDEPYHDVGLERNTSPRRAMIWKWWGILSIRLCSVLFLIFWTNIASCSFRV